MDKKAKRFKKEKREDLIAKIVGIPLLIIFIGALIGFIVISFLDKPQISETKINGPNIVRVSQEQNHYRYVTDQNSDTIYLYYEKLGKEAISPVLNKNGSIVKINDYEDIENMSPDIVYISEKEDGYFYILDKTTGCVFLFAPDRGNGLMAPAYSENGLPIQFKK